MLCIREDIPSKSLTKVKLDNKVEHIFIEINLRSKNGSFLVLTTQNWAILKIIYKKLEKD